MPPAVCAAPLPPRYYDYYYIKLQHHHSRSLHIEGSDMMHKCRVHSIAFLCSTPSQVQFQLHHITTITLLYTTCNHRLKSHFFLKKRKRKERDGRLYGAVVLPIVWVNHSVGTQRRRCTWERWTTAEYNNNKVNSVAWQTHDKLGSRKRKKERRIHADYFSPQLGASIVLLLRCQTTPPSSFFFSSWLKNNT